MKATDGAGPAATPRRVTIITNGNFFARLGLQPLFSSAGEDLVLQVFVTTGLRKPNTNRVQEAMRLLRQWGVRYALYKVASYALPAIGQRIRRRPLFVRGECEALGIECHVARNANVAPAKDMIAAFGPDLLVSFSCPYKIRDELLELPRIGSVNVHSSLLPAYAGVCTYVHVLADGQTVTGVTVHEMVSRFDAGMVLAQQPIPISQPTSVLRLFTLQCRAAGRLLEGVVKECLITGNIGGTPQNLSERTYSGEPTRDDINRLRANGHRLIRVIDLPILLGDADNA